MNGAPIQPDNSSSRETRARLAWLACALLPAPLGWIFSTMLPLFPWMLLINAICSFAGVARFLRSLSDGKPPSKILVAYAGFIVFVFNIVILFLVEYSKTGRGLR